ncbi:hypothetical protein [Acinetobacter sp. MD2(2019)]|uniref:hypothetical protein n=1 Tax=Acinetobacter sp. MD2(2019) TaxID=2605273 RepID=UPI002D769E92|nr:hypothetical protein [Acinetobacter sp. MD2(2019)]
MSKRSNVPIAHVLLDYLDLMKFTLVQESRLGVDASVDKSAYIDQLDKMIKLLYAQNKQEVPKRLGIERLLISTIYKLLIQRGELEHSNHKYASIKNLFDYIAKVLKTSQIGYDYNGADSKNSDLKLTGYATEYSYEDDLFMFESFYYDLPSEDVFKYLISKRESPQKRIQPKCFDQDDESLADILAVKVNRKIEVFSITAKNIYHLIPDEIDNVVDFKSLYRLN